MTPRHLILLLTLATLACGLLTPTPAPIPVTSPRADAATDSSSPTLAPSPATALPAAPDLARA